MGRGREGLIRSGGMVVCNAVAELEAALARWPAGLEREVDPIREWIQNGERPAVERCSGLLQLVRMASSNRTVAGNAFDRLVARLQSAGLDNHSAEDAAIALVNDDEITEDLSTSREQLSEQNLTECQKWCYRIPFVNILYDLLFDNYPPSPDAVKSLLETLGLLSALLLTVAMAVPGSTTYDELLAAQARMDAQNGAGVDIILDIVVFTGLSVYMLGAAVCTAVVGLFCIPVSETWLSSSVLYQVWWKKFRYVVLWATMNTLLGVIFSFFAFNRLAYSKFPDRWSGDPQIMNPKSTVGWFHGLGIFVMSIPVCGLCILCGWAARDVVLSQQEKHEGFSAVDGSRSLGTPGSAATVAPSEIAAQR